MISLACQIFSVQPHSACVLLQSSLCCALHVQTISSYWCGAPHLSPLPWHCRSNGSWHGHYAGDGSVYPPSWPKSLLHAASHSSHMMSTPYLWSRGRWQLVRRGSNGRNLPHAHLQRVIAASSQPPPAESMSPFINSPSSPKASGAPEFRVRAQGSLNATAFLMHPALAATTEDCIRATNSWLTDTTGVLSRFLQHVQVNTRLHNLCFPHVHT